MRSDFWKGRRVLVTGHTGFKGSWLSLWLQRMGAQVIGYSLTAPTEPSLFHAADVGEGMVSQIADIRDLNTLKQTFADHKPEIVLHLAAQALVRASYENPVETYETNIMGTVNVLEAVRHCPEVRSVVIVTSDKCYANREWAWGYRENEEMGGHDPYSSSKGCAELVTSAFVSSYFAPEKYDQHGVAVASARAGNVIGGGDWAKDRLLPDIMRALQAGRPVIIRNPNSIRPWQHVLEPLRGYLTLAEALYEQGPKFCGGWNFGPSDEDTHPVSTIVELVTRTWGEGARWELDTHINPPEAHFLKLDCSKARSLLKWQPAMHLPEALESIVAWYRHFYRHCGTNGSARDHALQEIARYEHRLQCRLRLTCKEDAAA